MQAPEAKAGSELKRSSRPPASSVEASAAAPPEDGVGGAEPERGAVAERDAGAADGRGGADFGEGDGDVRAVELQGAAAHREAGQLGAAAAEQEGAVALLRDGKPGGVEAAGKHDRGVGRGGEDGLPAGAEAADEGQPALVVGREAGGRGGVLDDEADLRLGVDGTAEDKAGRLEDDGAGVRAGEEAGETDRIGAAESERGALRVGELDRESDRGNGNATLGPVGGVVPAARFAAAAPLGRATGAGRCETQQERGGGAGGAEGHGNQSSRRLSVRLPSFQRAK